MEKTISTTTKIVFLR